MNKQEMAELLNTVQKELEEVKVALAEMLATNRELDTQLNTLKSYAFQLQTKVKELESLAQHYEKTVNILSGRLQEKNDFIRSQNTKENKEEIE
jgi:cyclopropane fatty-acyl-phospholipid synthase-like methyltransferase|tara:strand:+ start:132 stop:413 length:282 start_codon:yes stop_codon:yes gene_type:complete